ncbi:MAG: hypothetical protein RBS48_04335 [Ignavibacteriaceae bacterium]|jgi:hypothetical protein|nr:hypothetical protein [Ignavibacteriaceae bacterium]
MDSIIDYLIAFFFIVSILGGLFGDKNKKRKSEEARKARANERPDATFSEQKAYRNQSDDDRFMTSGARKPAPDSTRSSQKSNKDILEEMFGVKMPKTDNWSTIEKPNQYGEVSTWDPESEFKESKKIEEQKKKIVDYDLAPSLETIYDAKSKYSNASRTDIFKSKSNSIASKVEHFRSAKNNKVMAIRSKLDDNITLKDMIIITEILNKPKALRRR